MSSFPSSRKRFKNVKSVIVEGERGEPVSLGRLYIYRVMLRGLNVYSCKVLFFFLGLSLYCVIR